MVRVVVPSMLAAQAEGRQRFSIDRGTLGEALHALPVADLIFNERGELNQHLNVYVDGIDARELGGLSFVTGRCPGDTRRSDGVRRLAGAAHSTNGVEPDERYFKP